MTSLDPIAIMDLADWRRSIAELYAEVRSCPDPKAAWRVWRAGRDRLFRHHPQSPIPGDRRESLEPLSYYDYDDGARVMGRVEPVDRDVLTVATSDGNDMRLLRFAVVAFELYGQTCRLDAFWLETYAGGLFLPFGDATNRSATYGAGRYLLDTAKGSDLGAEGGALILDFNFAYNPSCSYDARWACPLAPPSNRLSLPVEAGEKAPG